MRLRVSVVEEWFGSADDPDRSFVLFKDGVILGITLGLRLGCIIAIMPLVTMTTSLTDLMLALVKLKVPLDYRLFSSYQFSFCSFTNELNGYHLKCSKNARSRC